MPGGNTSVVYHIATAQQDLKKERTEKVTEIIFHLDEQESRKMNSTLKDYEKIPPNCIFYAVLGTLRQPQPYNTLEAIV